MNKKSHIRFDDTDKNPNWKAQFPFGSLKTTDMILWQRKQHKTET